MKDCEFKVGDEVVDLTKGEGVVTEIFLEELCYPIYVNFEKSNTNTLIVGNYTYDGKNMERDLYPSLYHKGTEINIKPAKPKRPKWINLYYNKDSSTVNTGIFRNTKKEAKKEACSKKFGYGNYVCIKTVKIPAGIIEG